MNKNAANSPTSTPRSERSLEPLDSNTLSLQAAIDQPPYLSFDLSEHRNPSPPSSLPRQRPRIRITSSTNPTVIPPIPAQDQNYGLYRALLEDAASTYDLATKDPKTAIRTGPPPKKREVIIIDSSSESPDSSDEEPTTITDKGKKKATEVDKSRTSTPEQVNIDDLFLKPPVFQDNPTNASTSQQTLPSMTYELFRELTASNEQFNTLLQEVHGKDDYLHATLVHHRNYQTLSEAFAEDHRELERIRNIVVQLTGSQGILLDSIEKHQEEALTLARHQIADYPMEGIVRTAPNFFKHITPEPADTRIPMPPPAPIAKTPNPIPRSPILTDDWASKTSWLATFPYFQNHPERLRNPHYWNHPLQKPYVEDHIWYSSHQPIEHYKKDECHRCHLHGHIKWSCPSYECQFCNQRAPGHRPINCKYKAYCDPNAPLRTAVAFVPPLTLPQKPITTTLDNLNDLIKSLKANPTPPTRPRTRRNNRDHRRAVAQVRSRHQTPYPEAPPPYTSRNEEDHHAFLRRRHRLPERYRQFFPPIPSPPSSRDDFSGEYDDPRYAY